MAKQGRQEILPAIILKAAGWALLEQYFNNFLNANFPLGIQLGYVTIHWATEKQNTTCP
jgi:hypothetical protein